jgi:hypothetical protein
MASAPAISATILAGSGRVALNGQKPSGSEKEPPGFRLPFCGAASWRKR